MLPEHRVDARSSKDGGAGKLPAWTLTGGEELLEPCTMLASYTRYYAGTETSHGHLSPLSLPAS